MKNERCTQVTLRIQRVIVSRRYVSFETQFGGEGELQVENKDATGTPARGQPTKVMTVREVSAYLHVHPTTIYRLLRKKKIPAFHIGSDWRFNIEDIDRWRLGQKEPSD